MKQLMKSRGPAGGKPRGPRPATPRQAAKERGAVDRALDAGFFKALADPTRLALLACIAKCGRGCGVSEVGACCSVDLSVVSRHLSVLLRAGVLEVERSGREAKYRVQYEAAAERLRVAAEELAACAPRGDEACGCEGGGCGC